MYRLVDIPGGDLCARVRSVEPASCRFGLLRATLMSMPSRSVGEYGTVPIRERTMPQYSFTMHVIGIRIDNEYYEDALYNAGCTDALIVIQDGELFLDFDRQAPSYDLAVQSATHSVRQAGGRVIGVDRIS